MLYMFVHHWKPNQIFSDKMRIEGFMHFIKGASLAKFRGECLAIYSNFDRGLAWQIWNIQEEDVKLFEKALSEHKMESEIIPIKKVWPNIDRLPIPLLLSPPEPVQFTLDDV